MYALFSTHTMLAISPALQPAMLALTITAVMELMVQASTWSGNETEMPNAAPVTSTAIAQRGALWPARRRNNFRCEELGITLHHFKVHRTALRRGGATY